MNNLPVEIVLQIVIKYKSLDEVKRFCSQSIRNARICNANKNYICFNILKNNFQLLPYNLSTISTISTIVCKQITKIQKIYPEFPINITQKIAFKIIKLNDPVAVELWDWTLGHSADRNNNQNFKNQVFLT